MFFTIRITGIFLFMLHFSYSQKIEIRNVQINDAYNHFSPFVHKGKLYYSHNLKTKKGKPVKDFYGQYVYTLYSAYMDTQGEINHIKPVKKTKSGKFNMSVATITRDGKYMYFTGNADNVGENNRKEFKTFNLQLQRAEFVKGKGWTNFVTLPFCMTDYNYGHPALSPDEKTLYFVSNIGETKGRTDIFKVCISGHREYGDPVILSKSINSPRAELYPFISKENILYFSSNRRGGIGGYDIYSYDLSETDETIIPRLLPKPINSVGEDFSFFLNEDGKSGFFTSRRLRGKGSDDIYYFTGF